MILSCNRFRVQFPLRCCGCVSSRRLCNACCGVKYRQPNKVRDVSQKCFGQSGIWASVGVLSETLNVAANQLLNLSLAHFDPSEASAHFAPSLFNIFKYYEVHSVIIRNPLGCIQTKSGDPSKTDVFSFIWIRLICFGCGEKSWNLFNFTRKAAQRHNTAANHVKGPSSSDRPPPLDWGRSRVHNLMSHDGFCCVN